MLEKIAVSSPEQVLPVLDPGRQQRGRQTGEKAAATVVVLRISVSSSDDPMHGTLLESVQAIGKAGYTWSDRDQCYTTILPITEFNISVNHKDEGPLRKLRE